MRSPIRHLQVCVFSLEGDWAVMQGKRILRALQRAPLLGRRVPDVPHLLGRHAGPEPVVGFITDGVPAASKRVQNLDRSHCGSIFRGASRTQGCAVLRGGSTGAGGTFRPTR